VAQELYEQYPEFVSAPKEHRTEEEIRAENPEASDKEIEKLVEKEKTAIRYWAVDYLEMVPITIKAIQELFNINEAQDLKLESLETQNQMLKDELCEKDNTYSWCLQELYYCEATDETIECPYGISGGIGTRCYKTEELNSWFYCSSVGFIALRGG